MCGEAMKLHIAMAVSYCRSVVGFMCFMQETIACAIVGSSLDYVNSILTGIYSRNIHRLQRVQNS